MKPEALSTSNKSALVSRVASEIGSVMLNPSPGEYERQIVGIDAGRTMGTKPEDEH